MTMKKLCVDLQSLLSSSLQIDSYKRAVEELVYNSLDAEALSIAIRVNIEENKIQVIDNGNGISEIDFDLIGQKFMTSKCVDLNTLKSIPNTYGFRGQSLANIINISQTVKITSRSKISEDTGVKIFCNGKLSELTKTTTRPSAGTTVEIAGLFYNLHIKNKVVDALGELNDIKTYLKQLSLLHTNISLSLRDDSRNEIIFQVHKNRDVYQTLKSLFDVDSYDFQEFKVEKKTYKVTAYIERRNKDISKHHWIYLNRKYLNKSKLHKIINDNLVKSSKLVNDGKVKSKVADNIEVAKCTIPFYIIIITCPYYDYDISELTNQTIIEFKNWQYITKLLEKLVKFYTGDEHLKTQFQLKTNKQRKENGQIDDTRDQVRKIVDKLLKSGSKKLGVSQMQNGIKGKLTKRKIKKRQINISISKVIPPKNNTISESINEHIVTSRNNNAKDILLHRNISKINNSSKKSKMNTKTEKKVANKTLDKKKIYDNKELFPQLKKNTSKNVRKACKITCLKINNKAKNKQSTMNIGLPVRLSIQSKEVKEKQVNKKNEIINSPYLINSRYESYINQLQRCHSIENKYKKFKENLTKRNRNRNDNHHKISVNERIEYSNIINNSNNVSIQKRIEEVIVYDYIPHPLNFCDYYKQNQYNHNSKLNRNTFVSSHDLVKTILNSQCRKTPTRNSIRKAGIYNENFQPCHLTSSIKINNEMSNNVFISRLTYESHDYNKNNITQSTNVHKQNVKKQFITKQSRDNFIGPSNQQNRKTLCNNKLKSQIKNLFSDKWFKLNFNKGFEVDIKKNNYLQESSHFIEFSTSNDKEKKNHGQQIVSSPGFISNAIIISNRQLSVDQKKTVNSDILRTENTSKSKVGNTYTISNQDMTCLSIINFDGYCFQNDDLDYSRHDLQATYTVNDNEYHKKKNCSDCFPQQQNYLNGVSLSKPDINQLESNKSYENIDPLNVCATILSDNSTGVVKDELGFNKYSINNNESLFNSDINVLNNDIAEYPHNIHNSDEIENKHELEEKINATKNIMNPSNNKIQPVNIEQMEEDIGINTTRKDVDDKASHEEKNALNSFNIMNRLNFIPKGMSQIFENCNTKTACEYSFGEDYFENVLYNNFANNIQINTKIYEPRVEGIANIADIKIEKVNAKRHKENASLTFDEKSLKQAKVLGQVDDKFIAAILKAKSNSLCYLVLFDQHAVHERIRLEKNLSDYLQENKWNSVTLDNILLKLSRDEILYLHNFKDKFAQFGLQWNVVNNNEVSVNAIPKAILGKNPRQVDNIIKAVRELFLEEINILKTQRGCISLYPKSIMELVFSEACRYAIKFGDKLTIDGCVDLLFSLSKCKTPFQCAHGRPVMAVILDIISADNICKYKVDISKVHAFHMKYKN